MSSILRLFAVCSGVRPFGLAALSVAVALTVTGCLGLAEPVRLGLVTGSGSSLTVDSTPAAGAAIFLNGQATGAKTPHTFSDLAPGTYRVRLVRQGYPDVEARVAVGEGKDSFVRIDLAAGTGRIEGFVTEGQGGPGVANAKVAAANSWTMTDERGFYALHVPPGRHDIVVTKPGCGTGVAQDVTVGQGETVVANVIQREAFRQGQPAEPLELTVTGLAPGDVVSYPIAVTVEAAGVKPVHTLSVRIGHRDPKRADHETTAEAITFVLDPEKLGPGPGYVHIEAYDIDYNWVQRTIPFVVNLPGETNAAVPAPLPRLTAYTTSVPAYLSSLSAGGTFGMVEEAPYAASGGVGPSHFVSIAWDPVDEARGYRIFRRLGETGDFVPLADVPGSRTSYVDADPLLQPGSAVYYRLAVIDHRGNMSSPSDPVRVFFLEPFSAWLVAPGNGSVLDAGTVELRWQAAELPASTRNRVTYRYKLRLQKVTEARPQILATYTNVTSVEVDGLAPCTQYAWDLTAAAAVLRISDRAEAVSVSGSSPEGTAINGAVFFATACPAGDER